MRYVFRKYDENDLDDVLSSWESAALLSHPFLTRQFMDSERHNIPNVYLPNADTWVAVTDEQVVGFIALLGHEVGAVFVHPDYHGTGAGLALMNKAQELHGDLEVEVFEENTIGRKFYSSYGFQKLREKTHKETGRKLLRLKFTASNASPGKGRRA